MARIHGRKGAMMIDPAGDGTLALVPFINKWSMPRTTDQVDVSALGDTNKQYVTGLPDSKGTYGGFFDTATAQMYTAAGDGNARKFYLYADISGGAHNYWFGKVFLDTTITGGVSEAVAISGNFSAASDIVYVT